MLTGHKFSAAALVITMLLVSAARPVMGYTPESPEVQQLINKALGYLEQRVPTQKSRYFEKMLGGHCLVALAAYKHSGNKKHPLVLGALERINSIKQGSIAVHEGEGENYSLGLAVIFLCDFDPATYEPEIKWFVNEIVKRQRPNGGWGYHDRPTGDMSQVQYAALGLWMAHRAGIEIDRAVTDRLCNFLIRVQDPTGGYGYQTKDPGNYTRVPQKDQEYVRPTMGAAGTGSLYVCAELMGLIRSKRKIQNAKIPPALRRVTDVESESVDLDLLKKAIADGNRFLDRGFQVQQPLHQAYTLYSIERYQAFREFATGNAPKEPGWYNAGVDFLKKTQQSDGSWMCRDAYGNEVETAFNVLFLLRSSKKTIARVVEESGITRGGNGLPSDLTKIAINQKGQVIDTNKTLPMDKLLDELDKDDNGINPDIPKVLKLSKDPKKRNTELSRLRRMSHNGPYQARLTAVNTLGSDRNLSNVPYLIFALSDPDVRVVKAARDGLRFISRKIDGYGMPDEPTQVQWQEAQQEWTAWLLSVRPDAPLLD